MIVYCATCNKYDHLLPGFAAQFNRYWGEHQEVTILGFRQPPPLPSNFRFHQMEEVETRSWTENLRRFFESVDTPRFVFLLDDYWLIDDVDLDDVTMMEERVAHGAVKGDLSQNTFNFAHTVRPDGLLLASPDAHYRTSTQPAVWSREYMLALLADNLNPWQFELQNNPAVRQGDLVGPAWQIFCFANIYFKGEPAQYMIDLIPAEDMLELRKAGHMAWLDQLQQQS